MSFVGRMVDLREVISLDVDKERVDSTKEYDMVGVYSFGRGLFNKEPVFGGSSSYKYFYKLHSHHIVMSQLFGWEGAIALCSSDFSGKYVSTQFPTFTTNSEYLDREYFSWWFRRQSFWDVLKSKAKGMGDRRRTLNPEALFSCQIPLPPISEQRRIVRMLEPFSVKIEEAKCLSQDSKSDMKSLMAAMAHRNDLSDEDKKKHGWANTCLGEVLTKASNPIEVELGKEYSHFGIYSFARGLFKKQPLDGNNIKASRLYQVKEGQFIYGRLNAYEGAFGIVTSEFDGRHVSNEFPTFECNKNKVLPEFLLAYFSSPFVWESLKRKVTGIGGGAGNRRIRLKESDLINEKIWIPPLVWQKKIKSVAEGIGSMNAERESLDLELDALLPSILDKAFKGELA